MSYLVKPLRKGVRDSSGAEIGEPIEVNEPSIHWLRAEQTGDVEITEMAAAKPGKKAKE
jgi:hypothetical protein